VVSWRFLSQTKDFIPEVERFHHLISGIYKPAWSEFALSIVMKSGSPYKDKDDIVFLDDGRWLMTYSPRSGGLNISDNRALVRCMDIKMPLAVFKQATDKSSSQGSTYLVLGLGLITNFDANSGVFIIESVDRQTLEKTTSVIPDEEARYEVQLYAQLTNEFRPFVHEETVTYSVSAPKRDLAFRKVVLNEYEYHCSICGMKFHLGELIEAQAAHIVPKNKSGTDDPRNGLSLCRTHHWAFDNGLFSLSENYQVTISPIVFKADATSFSLAEFSNTQISLPRNETIYPHPLALDWHRKNIFHS
jgi:putative restriction endonuclease